MINPPLIIHEHNKCKKNNNSLIDNYIKLNHTLIKFHWHHCETVTVKQLTHPCSAVITPTLTDCRWLDAAVLLCLLSLLQPYIHTSFCSQWNSLIIPNDLPKLCCLLLHLHLTNILYTWVFNYRSYHCNK